MHTTLKTARRFNDLSDFFTLPELASVIGVSKATAYRMADQGRIPCIRLGRRIILSKNHLQQWIDEEVGFTNDSKDREEIKNA